MAKILTCNACLQQFEVPAEHADAPALQCPFCANIVANTDEAQGAEPAEADATIAQNLSEVQAAAEQATAEAQPAAEAETAPEPETPEPENPEPETPAQAEPAAAEAPSAKLGGGGKSPFPFAGKQPARPEPTAADPAPQQTEEQPQAAQPQAAQPEPTPQPQSGGQTPPVDQRTPEAGAAAAGEAVVREDPEPQQGGNVMEQMAQRLSEEQSGGVIVDGLPAEQRAADGSVQAPPEEEELTPEEDPHMAGYMGGAPGYPQPGMAAPTAPVDDDEDYDYNETYDENIEDDYYGAPDSYNEIVELPEGSKLPGRGRGVLVVLLILLAVGYFVIIFAATRNNGIFHFGRFGDTIDVMLGDGEPMEIKEAAKAPPPEDFEPIDTTTEKPRFQTALSRPVGVPIDPEDPESGLKALVFFGNITNVTGQLYDNVIFEGVIKSPEGGEISVSTPVSVLPPEMMQEFPDAASVGDLALELERSQLESWLNQIREKGAQQQLSSNTPRAFILVFTRNLPPPGDPNPLYEVRVKSSNLVE